MKRAIIMGASSGMGLEVAKLLLADGWRIGIAARRLSVLNTMKDENSEMVEVAQIDITMEDDPMRGRFYYSCLPAIPDSQAHVSSFYCLPYDCLFFPIFTTYGGIT